MRRAAVGVSCAATLALAAAPAAAKTVSVQPKLLPAPFSSGMPDYAVRCKRSKPVRLAVDPPRGTRVALNGGKAHADRFRASVRLVAGRALTLRFVSSAHRRTYRIRCLPKDFPHWRAWREGRPQAGWYLLTPNAKPNPFPYEGPAYAAIFDSHGAPVWWFRRTPGPFAFDLQRDGNLSWTGYAASSPESAGFEERRLDGTLVHTWQTVGDAANQHDFEVLPNGDALMVTYRPRDHVDMSRWGGSKDSKVLDGEIQEIAPDGHLVWAWNTKDHIALKESAHWIPHQIQYPGAHGPTGRPWYDIVHINSIELHGRLLIFSARYLDAVYGIDRETGEILWKLGGTHTKDSLKIVGDRYAKEDFGGQHDARLVPHTSILTVYDNSVMRDRKPRALALRLDAPGGKATLVQHVRFPYVSESICCGSARLLPGGDWVISWGNESWVTEQKPSGDPVFRLHFEGGLTSYRAVPVGRARLSRSAIARGMDAMQP